MKLIDLHMHTTHSDGTYTPDQLIAYAKDKALTAVAVTDHDTVSSFDEVAEAGRKHGVEIVPGIEISAQFDQGTLHILGYLLDPYNAGLTAQLDDLQTARKERNPRIVQKLNALGIDITYDEVVAESGGGQVGRPHFARVLIKKGVVKSVEEAFKKYLGKEGAAYLDKRRLSPHDAIKLVTEAGGIAVFAHPTLAQLGTGEAFETLLDSLMKAGLGGIEAYSSCQSREEAGAFRRLGEARGIFVTGGSDFHGANKPGVDLGYMGFPEARVSYDVLEAMRTFLADHDPHATHH